jgi:hypothetical protein
MIEITNDILPSAYPFYDLIHEYNLKIYLDDFGMGRFIFHGDSEIGYYFQNDRELEMQYTNEYGLDWEKHKDWYSLTASIESKINKS